MNRNVLLLVLSPNQIKPYHSFLKNWRPIHLLNTDYKIVAKVLANRLKNVLHHLISHCQTGFLKGRFIGENIRLALDIIDFTNLNNIPGFMVLLDFEKAFDNLNWSFIDKCLSLYNFGYSFRKWFAILYSSPMACLCNNG